MHRLDELQGIAVDLAGCAAIVVVPDSRKSQNTFRMPGQAGFKRGKVIGAVDIVGGKVCDERRVCSGKSFIQRGSQAPVAVQPLVAEAAVEEVWRHSMGRFVRAAIIHNHAFPIR